MTSRFVLEGEAEGPVLSSPEPLSFWGGVDPANACVIDARHPLRGASLAGAVLMMPTSRGSCSGSGLLLDLALSGRAPAALVFREDEDVLTLGALVAAEMFGRRLPVVRLAPGDYEAVERASRVRVAAGLLEADGVAHSLAAPPAVVLDFAAEDHAMLSGGRGEAARAAMRIVVAMSAAQGAERLIDVTRVHIDGCIYAAPAYLAFAEKMFALGARVRVPTTTNAISVDYENWRRQGTPPAFGAPAARLARAYLDMGARPSFTCAPYLLDDPPKSGESIAWAESNAAIFANSVLGARTAKHPDFLDLCIAVTGRAPCAGVYRDEGRQARRVLRVAWPEGADDAFWPLLGWLAGRASPDRIPLLRGLAGAAPSRDDLKALCAAFGTTSAAPMLMIEGVTPEARVAPDADERAIARGDFAAAWDALHEGPEEVDLVAFGSPHASLDEMRALAAAFAGRRRRDGVEVIVTSGRDAIGAARAEGILAALERAGVRVLRDLCWCSISEPVFPPGARVAMTNSVKYAHYGPGLSGRTVRFGALADGLRAALDGRAPQRTPAWLAR